jgi:KTSC domain-containing protein
MRNSTYLKHISYDRTTKQMTVMFKDGAVILYYNVHPRTVAAINTADSAGARFSQLMQDHKFEILKPAA